MIRLWFYQPTAGSGPPRRMQRRRCLVANHVAVTIRGACTPWGARAGKPVIIHNVLQSCQLIADSAIRLTDRMVKGQQSNGDGIAANLSKSLMLVTALAR